MKRAIFGLGVSGFSVLRKLKNDRHLLVVSQGEGWKEEALSLNPHSKCISENYAQDELASCDEIILSPGIPRNHKSLEKALSLGVSVISEVEFAYKNSSVPVIAITGSNGKTTTATMIAKLLESFGQKVFLGGNIGRPYSEIIGDDSYNYAVVELSSFQLESVDSFRPKISLITNITPNHMERYSSFESYKQAKMNIFKKQEFELLIASEEFGHKGQFIKIKNNIDEINFEKSNMLGNHNRENFFCAFKVCEKLLGNCNVLKFQSFVNKFKGPEYRLEYLGNKRQKEFFNDAKSTNLESTLIAIKSFKDLTRVSLVLGGRPRSNDVSEFKKLTNYRFREIICIGEVSEQLNEILSIRKEKDLKSFFKTIDNKPGVILFSPGFPSFDQYKNYLERGADFSQLFGLLGES